jgi:probable HAF family extracellular repeat protein
MRTRTRIISAAILAATVCVLLASLLWPRQKTLYRATILPSLGGNTTTPTGINNRGQVVGYAQDRAGNFRLFLWERGGGLQDLGPAMMAQFCINDAGQIAGTTQDPNGNLLVFLWDYAQGSRTLGTLGGKESTVCGLNNHGQVVGWSRTAGGLKHAFVWEETSGMRDLGTLGGGESEALAINDRGQILGVSDTAEGERDQLTLWASTGSATVARQVQHLSGRLDLNHRGYVVGLRPSPEGADSVALWREDTGVAELFRIRHEINHGPFINDANQILFADSRGTPPGRIGRNLLPPMLEYYLWDPKQGRIGLNRDAHVRRWETLMLFDLNNNGCMVGQVRGPGMSYVRPVLLEPIPERWGR